MNSLCAPPPAPPSRPNLSEWFLARLLGLRPADFHAEERVRFYTAFHVKMLPEELRGSVVTMTADVATRDFFGCSLALLFCNVHDNDQVKLTMNFLNYANAAVSPLPLLVMVPSCAPKASLADFATFIEAGVHILADELAGKALLCAVRGRVMTAERNARAVAEAVRHRRKMAREMAERATDLRESCDYILWEYFPQRLRLAIPPIDYNLDVCCAGMPLVVGPKLGSGTSGDVYELRQPGSAVVQAVKLVSKNQATLREVKGVGREIALMQEMCKRPHPNVIQSYETYHTPTEILYRMEFGGSHNLHTYLRRRRILPLGAAKASSIAGQCIVGVSHLHLENDVAHGDIKPENIAVSETADGSLPLKFCDFGLAVRSNRQVRNRPGTYPFMAPETITEGPFRPYPADIWSLGIVFLEVLCGNGVVEKAVVHRHDDTLHRKQHTVHGFILRPGGIARLLAHATTADLRGSVDCAALGLVEMMLTASPVRRIFSRKLSEHGLSLLRSPHPKLTRHCD